MAEKKDRKPRREPEDIARDYIDNLQKKLREIRTHRVLMTLDTDASADQEDREYRAAIDDLVKVANYIDGNESAPTRPPGLGNEKPE